MKNNINGTQVNEHVIGKLMFRLLPMQIILVSIPCLNGIISSLFASNFLDVTAVGVVGLYAPILMLQGSVNLMLMGGATIISGEYIGRNEREKMNGTFSLDLMAAFIFSLIFSAVLFCLGRFNLSGIFTKNDELKPAFSLYLIGQSAGIIPFLLASQLSAFLSLENKSGRTTFASAAFVLSNIFFNWLFISYFKMGVLGLALAPAAGSWIFLLCMAGPFVTGKSIFRFTVKGIRFKDIGKIIGRGYQGALSNLCQTLRGFALNAMIESYVGAIGLSAFCAVNNTMALAWCIPTGMVAVSRMVMSVAFGEEDRAGVVNTMRVMFKKFCLVSNLLTVAVILLSWPLTTLFFKDTDSEVFKLSVWGFRIMALSFATGTILLHFVCFGQISERRAYTNTLAVLDGVVFAVPFTAMLIPFIGMNGVYVGNVLNGVATTVSIFVYSIFRRKRFPKNVEDLMVIPESFGVSEDCRLDFIVRDINDVVNVSKAVQDFCTAHGVDSRRAYFAALALEEMAGNIVEHGFSKDRKNHLLELRVVYTKGQIVLRTRDDCISFDPFARLSSEDGDVSKNIGIRLATKIARSASWQSVFGMNALTLKI